MRERATKVKTYNVDGTSDMLDDCALPGMMSAQKTLAGDVKLTGIGLHSGGQTSIAMHPAPEDTGIVFVDGTCEIPAIASNVIDTSRGTTIGVGGGRVRTIEHVMAALRGLGVDNAIVEVFGPETPAMDGSAYPCVEAIEAVGTEEQDAVRKYITLTEPICVRRGGSFILAVPSQYQKLTYVMNYVHPLIGAQMASYELDESDFSSEIAPARTFALYEEVASLLEQRLARGGSVENAIVIWQDHMSSELRYPDELVRHKVVDLIGDLSLVGGLLQADILAVKSGHSLNVEMALEIERMSAGSLPGAPAQAITA